MSGVKLDQVIAPAFYNLHHLIKGEKYTHYWIGGGRGSTKSSFISIEIILGIMKNTDSGAIVFRKIGADLKDSVYNQLLWAIDVLGVSEQWDNSLSPLRLTYLPTGQKIVFRGVDDASKVKSIKLRNGYFKYIWFEEADQFSGMAEIRKLLQSIMRGGKKFNVFYSYNPPKRKTNWVNIEAVVPGKNKIFHHSTYKDVPKEWLGEQFFIEAETLKENNEQAYRHEYLGEATGMGGEVFTNLELREITDEEIKTFGHIYYGLDFGFSIDPCAFVCCCLHNYKLYIFDEFYETHLGYDDMAKLILAKNKNNELVYCDCAEPRSIYELGLRKIKATKAGKGAGSINHGITRLANDLIKIVIDPVRCPNAAREFSEYELEVDKNGEIKHGYPDKNNHTIDAVRYALCNTDLLLKNKKEHTKQHYDFSALKPKPNAFGVGCNANDLLRG